MLFFRFGFRGRQDTYGSPRAPSLNSYSSGPAQGDAPTGNSYSGSSLAPGLGKKFWTDLKYGYKEQLKWSKKKILVTK